jgi:hypothetical protein
LPGYKRKPGIAGSRSSSGGSWAADESQLIENTENVAAYLGTA